MVQGAVSEIFPEDDAKIHGVEDKNCTVKVGFQQGLGTKGCE